MIQVMNSSIVVALVADIWVVRVKKCPPLVQRQRAVPLVLVPFFSVVLLHTGQRSLLVIMGISNLVAVSTGGVGYE